MRITSPPLILAINGAVAAAEFAVIAPVTASAPEFTAASVEVPDADSVVNAPAAGVLAPTVPLIFIEAVPVKFVTIPLLGVPNAGVTNAGVTSVGEVANTLAPVPVSSVSAVANCAEVNEPSDVALPIEVIGPVRFALVVTVEALVAVAAFPPIFSAVAVPVTLVITPEAGVPNAGVTNAGVTSVGEVANTLAPDPVSSVSAVASWAEVNAPKDVALPMLVTAPVRFALVVTLPAVKLAAVPVMFVPTSADGVPSAGVTSVGLVLRTVAPVPVEIETPVPPLTTGSTPENVAASTARKLNPSLNTEILAPAATATPRPAAVVLPNTVEL
jgi:hypothetical protein